MKAGSIGFVAGRLLTDAMILGNYIREDKEYRSHIKVDPQSFKYIVIAWHLWIYHAALLKIAPKGYKGHLNDLIVNIDYWTSEKLSKFKDIAEIVYKEMEYLRSGLASGIEKGIIFLRLISQNPSAFEPQVEHMNLIGFINPLPLKLMPEYEDLIKDVFDL